MLLILCLQKSLGNRARMGEKRFMTAFVLEEVELAKSPLQLFPGPFSACSLAKREPKGVIFGRMKGQK